MARDRERDLTALFDTARDLAALRDRDAVLRAIVRRARTLLGTEVAYLTLVDHERDDTWMRVTDGSVSARFQRVRLPRGAGLGGLVADTAMPYATADYFADPRFRHTSDIDDAVLDEGLVAILGVPLPLGSEVIGVLFAADRSARPFLPDEIALLASLAALAAVAIDSARLLAETQSRLRELDAAHEVVRAHATAVERAADAHDRLAKVVLGGGDVTALADAVVEVLGGSLSVHDADGRQLAAAGPHPPKPPGPAAPTDQSAGRARAVGGGRWTVTAATSGEPLGQLTLARQEPLDGADIRILERAALVTALLLLVRHSAAVAEEQVRGDLLADLLVGPDRAGSGHLERARRLGVDLARGEHCVLVASAEVTGQRLISAAGRLARTRVGLATARTPNAVLLLPGADPGDLARRCAKELTATVRTPVTVGSARAIGAGIPAAYEEADRCRRAMLALGRTGDGAGADELGFVGLLLADRGEAGPYVERRLGTLLAYDAARGTDLVGTLRCYFAAGLSLRRAKVLLHVHVNTVVQRLERITALLGPDWQQPDRILELQLALRLHDVLPHAGGNRPAPPS